ncbi:MAG TPA: metallopeptidase family protein [Tepidisphaeraceae bacterium]|nr:metallopeptidase family protein [Tepidisphaeraceae bacterium]
MPYAVSKNKFAELVEAALAELPAEFAKFLEEVPVEIRDRPTRDELAGLHIGPGSLLLGLYRGRPRTRRTVEDTGTLPDVIYIFQDNIQAVCRSEDELIRQVRKTVLHEIGHHFGLSEQDLDRLGYG